jgi:glycosyltransferase involved in cell wall biosynthesis
MGLDTMIVDRTRLAPHCSRCIYYEPLHWEAWFNFIWRHEPRRVYYATIEGELCLNVQMAQTSRSFKVVTCSNFVREMLEKVHFQVTDVCWHAIDFKLLDDIRRLHENEPRFPERPLKMVYIGDTQPRKGLKLLAEAVRTLHQQRPDGWELWLYTNGYPEDGKISWFSPDGGEKWTYDFTGIPNVHMVLTGMSWDHTKLMHAVASCDLYVQPSLGEGFGVPLLEAWGLGLPTICARFPPFVEFVPDEVNFWLDWVDTDYYQWQTWQRQVLHLWDPNQWVQQILAILDNPSLLASKRACTREVARRFDYMAIYPKLIRFVL